MYLKRVEILGFKSFPERTVVEVEPGITAFVGPNGSGKSNLSDAVRWVLGEQSARELRGSKMEDIIFGGTDTRRGLGMAEVTLVLDNSDGNLPLEYSEVSLTRRLYRSGESEYYINRVACRLKDITDLLADTGVGREAYSVISQGKVDEILSHRPEDRRGLFEEAAGITKYKSRKREAVRKLEDTENDLGRLGDILLELENQLGPLGEQAQTARLYQSLRQEADGLEISLLGRKYRDLHEELAQIIEKNRDYANRIAESDRSLEELEAEEEDIHREQAELDKCLQSLQERVAEVGGQIGRWEEQLSAAAERRETAQREQARLREEERAVQQRRSELAQQLVGVQIQTAELEKKLETARSGAGDEVRRAGELEASLERLEREVEAAKEAIIEDVQRLAELRNQGRTLEAALESEGQRLQGFKHRQREAAARLEEARAGRERLLKALDELRRTKEEIAESGRAMQAQQEETRLKAEAAAHDHTREQERLAALRGRLAALRESRERYDGYARGVKTVLAARDRGEPACRGVIGALADQLTADRRFGKALEMALGGAAQNIVVEDDASAESAIGFLKARNGGRATFLPLNTMQWTPRRDTEDAWVRLPGVIAFAEELVRGEPRLEPVIRALLGRVLVVEDLTTARRVARQSEYRLKIVTLDGDVVHRGGSLSGGSYGREISGLFVQKQELEALEEEERRLIAAAEEAANRASRHQMQVRQLSEQMERLQRDFSEQVREEAALAKEIEAAEAEIKRWAEALALAEWEAGQAARDLERRSVEAVEVRQAVARLEESHRERQEQLAAADDLLKKERQQLASIGDAVTAFRVQTASLEADLAHSRTRIEELEGELADVKNRLERIHSEQVEVDQLVKSIEERRLDVAQRLANVRHERIGLEEQLAALRARRQNLHEDLSRIQADRKRWRRSADVLAGRLRQGEVEAARLESESVAVVMKLRDSFGMEVAAALERMDDDFRPTEAEERLRALKGAMADLGAINPTAIDEFARVKDRYHFLMGQKSDLAEARDSLMALIDDLDGEMARRFVATFRQISQCFQGVFGELFTGGRAELTLVDPDRPLESGVEILVQPPGKRLQSLSLLSGGERSLTAIAILFAIARVRPSPFCILDEIDAALDEANIDKYTTYLRKLARDTQFLIITHQRRTMEAADALYGVTMQEPGVSTLVSVRLVDRAV
ncbi:MAG: chromosome segregation protein SMC [Bacillota bacterium]